MEHESFEDEATAAFMNRHFVCVKLDREERPDLDAFYMSYVMAATRGRGGWPASIWMTADKQPFYAGTYFPKEPRFGRPSFMQVLEGLAKAWKDNRQNILAEARRNVEWLAKEARTEASKTLPSPDILVQAAGVFFGRHDRKFGGFRAGGPKFPSTTTHELLFLGARLENKREWARAAAFSLERMARGGIYDHVGGGFHRYSVDARWFLPHFEKMLYDQARIAATLLDAFQVTGNGEHLRVAQDTIACVLRDFRSPEGAFMCAYDADSGGHEGTYYIWSTSELAKLLADETYRVVRSRFSLTEEGNWDETPGRNILYVRATWDEVAAETKLPVEKVRALWEAARPLLLKIRNKRPKPGLDNKILSGWNGLMITALARSARIGNRADHLEQARKAASFVLSRMRRKDGSLHRRFCEGEVAFDAVLRDYAFMIQALIDLFEATGEVAWIEAGCALADKVIQLFADPAGGFHDSPSTGTDVLVRPKEIYDGAIPAGNGYLARALIKLSDLTARKTYRDRAEGTLKAFKQKLEQNPVSSPTLLHAARLAQQGLREIVIVGDAGWPSTTAMHEALRNTWLPDTVLCLVSDAQARAAEKQIPILAGKTSKDGRALAYVCRAGVCKLPISDPALLARELEQKP
jgi:uncharacterized protein YyaL (SSP411 family)